MESISYIAGSVSYMPKNIYTDSLSGKTYDLLTATPRELIELREATIKAVNDTHDQLSTLSKKLDNTDPRTHTTEDLHQQEYLKKIFDNLVDGNYHISQHMQKRGIRYYLKGQKQLDR